MANEGARWFAEARVIGGLRRDRHYCTVILAVREWAITMDVEDNPEKGSLSQSCHPGRPPCYDGVVMAP